MSTWRPWHWQLDQLGKGPDHYFRAAFELADAARLARLVREYLPPGYAPGQDFNAAESGCQAYACYLDQHTYQRLAELRAAGQPENVWYYGQIVVCDQQLRLEHSLAANLYADTDLLAALADAPGLGWREWSVLYGGDGYAGGEIARGADAASLLNYLRAAE